MRKPVSMVLNKVGNIVAICDDGTVWGLAGPIEKDAKEPLTWFRLDPPLPGSAADEEATGEATP